MLSIRARYNSDVSHYPVLGPAAPFSLNGTDGRCHSLDTYRGAWLLLVLHRHLR